MHEVIDHCGELRAGTLTLPVALIPWLNDFSFCMAPG
ncbi:hypothetical protein P3T43_005671 [Paraburkholderia sp. GAS41]|jgi:hypothetical protein